MNGKTLIFIITIIMLIPLLSFNVLAADDITNSDMVDAQGGFFRDIAGFISDGFNKSIEGVKNGISYIANGVGKIITSIQKSAKDLLNSIKKLGTLVGNGISNIIKSISDAVKNIINSISKAFSDLFDFIVDIFMPSKDYFPRIQNRLQTAINSKLGGILSFTEYLKSRFSNLSATSNADDLLVLEYPQGHFFGGTRVDLLYRVRPYIPLFRDLFTGIMMLLTGFYAYRQVKGMVNT